jgi:Protein of unknown function (DUF3025)
MFEPLAPHADALRGPDWPSRAAVQSVIAAARVRTASGLNLVLAAPGVGGGVPEGYEARIHARGEMAFRTGNWHDLFNALAWLAFPRAKAALNARHAVEIAAGADSARGPVRDALTLFDESGVAVVSADEELLGMVRGFRWKELFWHNRKRAAAEMRFVVFGHALHEKALAPYIGLTGHALLLRLPPGPAGEAMPALAGRVDAALEARIADVSAFGSTGNLAPLPLLGVPGWWPGNEAGEFYDDARYFRTGRGRAKRRKP